MQLYSHLAVWPQYQSRCCQMALESPEKQEPQSLALLAHQIQEWQGYQTLHTA